MATSFNTTDSTLGANLNVTNTVQQFPLGERATGTNGTVWIYGRAQTAVLQYDAVTIDSSFNINSLMAADVKAGKQIGTAQVAFAALDYGWICISGSSLMINVKASAQTSLPVIPSTVTGSLDTTAGVAAGVTTILGVQLLTTAGLTATSIGVTLTSPVLKL
jgi:hypothetical protein